MTRAAIPAAVLADTVLRRIPNYIRFRFLVHLIRFRHPFRLSVSDVIAEIDEANTNKNNNKSVVKCCMQYLNLARKSSS